VVQHVLRLDEKLHALAAAGVAATAAGATEALATATHRRVDGAQRDPFAQVQIQPQVVSPRSELRVTPSGRSLNAPSSLSSRPVVML
jgi:tetrahydromethanopterin S-methyltransferase subunit E